MHKCGNGLAKHFLGSKDSKNEKNTLAYFTHLPGSKKNECIYWSFWHTLRYLFGHFSIEEVISSM